MKKFFTFFTLMIGLPGCLLIARDHELKDRNSGMKEAAAVNFEKAFTEQVGRNCPFVWLWPNGTGPGGTGPVREETFDRLENGSIRLKSVSKPSIIIIRPEKGIRPTGVTLVLCPGGGYGSLYTGTVIQEAKWLNRMGVTAVLLKYRVPARTADRDDHRLPLQDAQRAIGILRSRADEWNIDQKKIGIGGFSAGGHLAFNLVTHFKKRSYDPVDKSDSASCRPDFVVLHFPAYLTEPTESLILNPNLELKAAELKDSPPVFITVTCPDKFTIGCVKTLLVLQQAKVPVELHVYPVGGHGGCFDKYPLMEFARPLSRFLKDHGLLDDKACKDGNSWLDKQVLLVRKAMPGILEKKRKEARLGSVRQSVKTLAESIKSFTGSIEPLPGSRLTLGDKEIMKCAGVEHPVYQLWPGKGTRDNDPLKPCDEKLGSNRGGILRLTDVTCPSMMLFRPKKATGRSVLVFPGGGYGILASQHEGVEIANWLNSLGITVFLVKYRVPRRQGLEKHAVALEDAQRAIRLVRGNFKQFGIDPFKIGVLGFSAGGHLAALTCFQFDTPSYKSVDQYDNVSCRPDFGVLPYPAYTTIKRNGSELDPLLASPRFNYTPPLYIAIAANDPFMPGTMYFFLKNREKKVAVECHVYEKGGHGQGLRKSGYPFSEWIKPCARWMGDLDDK